MLDSFRQETGEEEPPYREDAHGECVILVVGSAASTVEIIALARRDAPGGSRRDRQIFAGEFENRLLGPDHPSIFPTFEDQVHISAVEQVASCRFRHRRNLRCGSPHNCQACGFTSGAGSLPADRRRHRSSSVTLDRRESAMP